LQTIPEISTAFQALARDGEAHAETVGAKSWALAVEGGARR